MVVKKINDQKENIRVSFLPGEQVSYDDSRRFQGLLAGILVALVVFIGGGAFYLRYSARGLRAQSDARIDELKIAESALGEAEKKVLTIGNIGQLAGAAKRVLLNHRDLGRAFDLLESTTIPEVTFSQLAVENSGTLTLSGSATSIEVLSRQLQAWHNAAPITEARVSGMTIATDKRGVASGIDFTAGLRIKRDYLKWTPAP